MISLKKIAQGWDHFFFKQEATEGIALFRIVWMLIIGMTFLMDFPNRELFYGHDAVLSLKTVGGQFNYPHMGLFHMMGNSEGFLQLFFSIYALAIICALLGFYTRSSLIVVLVCMVSLHQRNIWLLSSSDLLIRATMILLVCSPCGHSLSLDSYFARKEGRPLMREWSPWVLRVLQIQLSVVYLWTVWHKLKGDTWFDGTALYYATRNQAMMNFSIPYLLDSMWFLKILTWGTLLLETALGSLIWIKEFRKPLIVMGVIFHLGIEYVMSIPFFEIVMIALLMNFFTTQELHNFVMQTQAYCRNRVSRLKESSRLRAGVLSLLGEKKT